MNENKVLNKNDLDFDNMERMISQEIEDSLSDLELLESDRQKIDNPEVLAKTIGDEIWKQFANQIGLEVTSETLIQKYNKEHSDESKNYNKEKYNDSYPLEYFRKGKARRNHLLHPETDALLESLLVMLAEKGEDYTFDYIRREVLHNKRPKKTQK